MLTHHNRVPHRSHFKSDLASPSKNIIFCLICSLIKSLNSPWACPVWEKTAGVSLKLFRSATRLHLDVFWSRRACSGRSTMVLHFFLQFIKIFIFLEFACRLCAIFNYDAPLIAWTRESMAPQCLQKSLEILWSKSNGASWKHNKKTCGQNHNLHGSLSPHQKWSWSKLEIAMYFISCTSAIVSC